MSKPRVWLKVLAAGATAAALAYVVTKRAQHSRPRVADVRQSLISEHAQPDRAAVPEAVPVKRDAAVAIAAIVDIVDEPTPTAQPVVRLPPPVGPDDAEAFGSDEIGANWLSRATESQHSFTEADLDIELEELVASIDESASDPLDEDDPESAGPAFEREPARRGFDT